MSLCDYIYDVHRQKGNIFRKREQINYIGRKKVEGMPWCPKCKTEYREGFTVCADCGSELVKEQPVEERKASRREAFPELEVPETESVEDMAEDGAEENDSADEQSDAETKSRKSGGGSRFQDSSERASENRSSAWMLLILGTLGLIAVVLGAIGVLPFRMGNPYLFYGVMGAISILFVIAGIVSMKNAKFFDKKAESENSLRSTLMEWCRENLDAGAIYGRVGAQGVSEEILYFRRFSYIKEKMNHQFVNLDQGFLDRFIDDYVYDFVFEGKEV